MNGKKYKAKKWDTLKPAEMVKDGGKWTDGKWRAKLLKKKGRKKDKIIATPFTFLPPHIHILNVIFQFRLGIFHLCVYNFV